MDIEDLVIGSGLAALGAVIGLEHSRSVLVLAGPDEGRHVHYDERATVPCAYLGQGGLGNDWHGVIPTGWQRNFNDASADEFSTLFARFYPRTPVRERLGQPGLFVPWRAIRPRPELARLLVERGPQRLRIVPALAERFTRVSGGVEVEAGGQRWRARRLWLAAGALHTPELVDRSIGQRVSRETASDHITCYVGMSTGAARPAVQRHRDGLMFPARYGERAQALYTLRPAHFEFARLDHAIEARAVFGMPTGNAVAKIVRRASPGLLAEAFYNRFGLFASARAYSVMAQTPLVDGYRRTGDAARPLAALEPAFARAVEAVRSDLPFDGVQLSRRPDIRIPGIHLHHTLDREALQAHDLDHADSPVQVVDASTLRDIGPDHHSFKMMIGALRRARQAVPATT
jgi:hypothetical protein